MTSNSKQSVKIFINHVDEYHGHYISKYLSKCVVGATLEDEEEQQEEEEGSLHEEGGEQLTKEGCYEVLGTLRDPSAEKPAFVKKILNNSTREELFEQLMEADILVYDITQFDDQIDEAMWILSELHHNIESLEKRKMFILLSTLMTWARSSPANEDDPDEPLTDENYKQRKPHPNYANHMLAEKSAVKYGKTRRSKLLTYIVGAGLTYGCGERVFHSLFKAAWHNAATLPVYGSGQNVLPMIHVTDLAAIIQNIADSKPKVKYILAVDDSQGQTQEAVVKAIAEALSTGKTRNLTKEEAALSKEVDQQTVDQLMLSLRVDAVFAKDNFQIDWTCEAGLVETTKKVVREFRRERGLLPVKVCVLGPPAAGKTSIVRQLCQHYSLHHVTIKEVIDEAIAGLERSAARADVEEEDDDGKAADDAELLEQVNECLAENDGRLTDEFVIRFFRDKLGSKPCQNQGFILDGFPKTKADAEALFGVDEDEEEEEEEEEAEEAADGDGQKVSAKLLPDHVFLLEADDAFLKQRVMSLPESEVEGTHNTEEGLLRRLAAFRRNFDQDNSALEFFENLELKPELLPVAEDTSEANADTVQRVKDIIGQPRNYGLTEEQIKEIKDREEADRLSKEKAIRDEMERRDRLEADTRHMRQLLWSERLASLRESQQQELEQRSEPLRNYLIAHVMPCLTQGLMQCAVNKPDDAVDYLAEYLFRNNPQID